MHPQLKESQHESRNNPKQHLLAKASDRTKPRSKTAAAAWAWHLRITEARREAGGYYESF
jgi:hypothetical protein